VSVVINIVVTVELFEVVVDWDKLNWEQVLGTPGAAAMELIPKHVLTHTIFVSRLIFADPHSHIRTTSPPVCFMCPRHL
jgi:hypothetical protein